MEPRAPARHLAATISFDERFSKGFLFAALTHLSLRSEVGYSTRFSNFAVRLTTYNE